MFKYITPKYQISATFKILWCFSVFLVDLLAVDLTGEWWLCCGGLSVVFCRRGAAGVELQAFLRAFVAAGVGIHATLGILRDLQGVNYAAD